MHAEASEYMKVDHADNPDFPDHFTYIPYDKVKVDEKLDYIFDRLFKEKYLDCELFLQALSIEFATGSMCRLLRVSSRPASHA